MNQPELSWSALEAVHDVFYLAAAAICEHGEVVHPQLIALQVNKRGGIEQLTPIPGSVIGLFFKDEQHKQAFARILHDVVHDTPFRKGLVELLGWEPNLFVQINEAWTIQRKSSEMPETRQPSQCEDRHEAIIIILHLDNQSVIVAHKIENEPKRHAIKSKFPDPLDVAGMSGRFMVQDAVAQSGPKQ